LKHLYDLWRYQAIFRDEIDWRQLGATFPHVIVVLRLVSCVFPGTALVSQVGAVGSFPAGVGEGMMLLSEIEASNMSPLAKLGALLDPPAWWLHGFYGIPLERSLLLCRAIRHPVTLARWLLRRWSAGMGAETGMHFARNHTSGSNITE